MEQQRFLRRLGENILGNVLAAVVIACFGSSAVLTAIFVITLPRRFEWISGPALLLLGIGVFSIVFAVLLTLLPRWWRPTGPFGKVFGTAPLMMGFSEERNKQVFMHAPRLRDECDRVSKHLSAFAANEMKGLLARPLGSLPEGSPERVKLEADLRAQAQRFTTLYHTMWRRKVETLLIDARAMFFGPIPPASRFVEGRVLHPNDVSKVANALDALSKNIPPVYTEAIHQTRVERLRRLRKDGLTLSADLGQFMVSRHQQIAAVQEAKAATIPPGGTPLATFTQWRQSVDFNGETEAMFQAQFGGLVIDVLRRLDEVGLSDEHFERLFSWGPIGLRVSSYEIGGLAGSIAAACQQIPYD